MSEHLYLLKSDDQGFWDSVDYVRAKYRDEYKDVPITADIYEKEMKCRIELRETGRYIVFETEADLTWFILKWG